MKLKLRCTQRGDTSLLDLFAILAAVAIVGIVGYAYIEQRASSTAQRIQCVNNLKCLGLGFRLWANDNGDKMPSLVSTNQGGAMELVAAGSPVPIFNAMSNELSTPKILCCPVDTRSLATNFAALAVSNLSYFVVPEADEAIPSLWLSGDRNLATNRVALKSGMSAMPVNRVWSWGNGIHVQNSLRGGNIGLADGSVQQCADKALHQSATNALAAFTASNSAPFRLMVP